MDDNMPGALIGQPFLYTGALGQGPGILHVRYYTAVEANAIKIAVREALNALGTA